MSSNTYHFKVGAIDCVALSDGTFAYGPPIFPPPANFLFVNAPGDRLGRRLQEYGIDPQQWETWTSAYTCLLVNTGEHRVLIDTGAGALGADTGRLLASLHAAGVDAGEIDYVILTHGHPDHLGGNVDAQGSLVFPQAQWIMSRIEWDFWMEGEAERALPEHVRDVLLGTAQRSLIRSTREDQSHRRRGRDRAGGQDTPCSRAHAWARCSSRLFGGGGTPVPR